MSPDRLGPSWANDRHSENWLDRPLDLVEVLDLAADAVLLLSEDQRILFFNKSAARIFGYAPEEIIGQPLDVLLPERFVEAHRAHMRNFVTAPENSRHMAGRQPVQGRRKDGTEFPLEISISRQDRAGVVTFAAIARDITDRLQAYQMLERRVEERTREIERRRQVAEGLGAMLAILNSNRPPDEILAHIVGRACQELSASAGAIFRLTEDQETLAVQEAQGLPADYIEHARLSLAQETLSLTVAARQPAVIPDMLATLASMRLRLDAQAWQASLGVARHYPAVLVVPLFIYAEFYGEIVLYFEDGREFSPEELHVAMMIGNQAALAIGNARLHEQAQAMAALEERQKLARELHDSVSQLLYGISLSAQTARAWLKRDPAKAAEPLEYSLSLVQDALTEMRALIFELRPESLEAQGLVAAIEEHVAAWQTRHGISVCLSLCAEPEAPMNVKETLYRVTREALQNILRHAHATQVSIQLESRDQEIFWEVKDNGVGFDPSASKPGHLGLRSMQERIEGVGGRFEVESATGQGACLRAHIPPPPGR